MSEAHDMSPELEAATIAKLNAEAQMALMQAAEFEAKAGIQALALAAAQRKERDDLAKDIHYHRYVFNGEVQASSVTRAIDQLGTWSRQDPGCDIEFVINSPGGDVIDGFALIDFMLSLRENGHHITTRALGMAASMGGVILQAGDTRIMGPSAVLLIHEASFGVRGSYGEVEDRLKLVDLMHDRILSLFTERSHMTKRQIQNKWQRKDWWIAASEALTLGFVDSIR